MKSLSLSLSLASLVPLANPAQGPAEAVELSDSVVEALTEEPAEEGEELVADATGRSVLAGEVLENYQGQTVADLFRQLPGVSGVSEGGRQNFRPNIRGQEGSGRVAVDIDGAPQNFFNTNHGANSNRLSIDSSLLKSVEVKRGAAANKSGQGSSSGSISFSTIDPADLLTEGERLGGRTKTFYESNGDGRGLVLAGAVQASEALSFLAAGSYKLYDDYEDGDGETIIGSETESVSSLAKAVYSPDDYQELKLSYLFTKQNFLGSENFAQGLQRNGTLREEDVQIDTVTLNYTNEFAGNDWLDLELTTFYSRTDRERTDRGASSPTSL
ncbi:TonB-dependent receptor plug domain-containing protein [Roseibacillus ishigakijimensis]|uniref:TonB-dependent receptor plug domain-containing protein n=1 Tax=Roseibacillus ishigakijimensis TaxID=454146 RepID=A0A934RR67_9BACT|nr:TonB-dependent receptor plug domain-containing protein [Roseibacillus ishigakijimensis]MBK1833953.1 TonB-dependent receptor plug domain-containing protein [Roseibacillus ishigakijimensis]